MIAVVVAAAVLSGPSPCTATELHPSKGELQGATGSMLGGVEVRNVSHARCALGGRPRVLVATRSGRVLRTHERTFSLRDAGGRQLQTLAAGQTAILRLDWSNWCGSWAGPVGSFRRLYLRATLTNGSRLTFPVLTGRPRCDERSAPSTLFVSPFVTDT